MRLLRRSDFCIELHTKVVKGGYWHSMALDRRFRNDFDCSMKTRFALGTQN